MISAAQGRKRLPKAVPKQKCGESLDALAKTMYKVRQAERLPGKETNNPFQDIRS